MLMLNKTGKKKKRKEEIRKKSLKIRALPFSKYKVLTANQIILLMSISPCESIYLNEMPSSAFKTP